MATPYLKPKRWSRAEYDRMIEAGVFAPGERVELINGEIITMTPQGSPHATSVGLVHDALRAVFGPDVHLRTQLPLAVSADSAPEPDVAVVTGQRRDYRKAHPTTALLVVEVADTTLRYDRQEKQRLYAQAGIRDYWIVDLAGKALEIYRKPGETDGHWTYKVVQRLGRRDLAVPLAAPAHAVAVADLLP